MAELLNEGLATVLLHDQRNVELPVELWLEIVAHLDPCDLPAMALVSRAMHDPAHSLLFRSCVFNLRYPLRLRSFIDYFYTSSRIAAKVHVCTVLGHRHNCAADVAGVCAAILYFSHLRHLTFQYVRMTTTTVAAISTKALSAPHPFELSLVSCITDFPVPSEDQEGTVPIQKFLLHNEHTADFLYDHRWLPLLNLDLLRVLDIAQPHSTAHFLEHLVCHVPRLDLPALEVLRLHLYGLLTLTEEFASALTFFPTLRIVSLACALSGVDHFLDYPHRHVQITPGTSTLPFLSSFHGPLGHAAAYCANRPSMRHLNVYGTDDVYDPVGVLPALTHLARTVPQLTSLELRIDFPVEDLLLALVGAFPALRSLRVVVPRYARRPAIIIPLPELADIRHTLMALQAPPHLEVLYLAYRSGNPSDSEPFAERIAAAGIIPAIRALGQRTSALRRICLCCQGVLDRWSWAGDVATLAREPTIIWRWTRNRHGGSMAAQWCTRGSEIIDGREANLGSRKLGYERYTAADALCEEWLLATAEHR
ncbi:hypothetical protein B0H19DRAFT_1382620 [Mycena capillaripes]|nr:hypothetical protein B0H19DRAFT_1382620 [Mycena capillaripes]